jgi:CMP-N-acetylneuraminic acid synthetase
VTASIVGVIPARGGSKGLPGKNVRMVGGVPLIVHAIRAARAATRLHDVVVTTDDPGIAEIARAAGVDVPELRPAALAGDEISVWPAIRHAVAGWESRAGMPADPVVILQPTSPLRTGADIDACIELWTQRRADICASAVRAHDSPYFNLVEPAGDSRFVRPCLPSIRSLNRQDTPPVYALNGAVYVVRRSILESLENQFAIERFAIYEMPRHRSVDIDSAEDLEFAQWSFARQLMGS